MPLIITFLAGVSIVVGAVISKIITSHDHVRQLSFSLALGALAALLIFDMIPDIREEGMALGLPLALILIVIGVVAFKILDLFIPEHEDTLASHDRGNAVHIGFISSLAIILHNIVEGMTVYSLSMGSLREGAVFAFGIALHNIPMGMLIYSTMCERSRLARRVVLSIVTLSTLLGGVLMVLVSGKMHEGFVSGLICLAAGMIIYIVFFELLPHVLRTRPAYRSAIGAAAGFALVFLSTVIG